MTRFAFRLAPAALLVAAFAVAQTPPPAVPQQPPPPVAQPGVAAPAGAGQAYRVKQVLGTKVNIQGNVTIGTVEDIVFDDAGQIEYLVVENAGKLVSLPWEAAKFNFEQRTATVNITQEKFRAIPTYTVTTYPTFLAPTYRVETYKYYGLTPRQERRIERKIERENRP